LLKKDKPQIHNQKKSFNIKQETILDKLL